MFLFLLGIERTKRTKMYFIKCVCVLSCSVVSNSLRPHGPVRSLCPWNFSRQEYWSRLPFPTPEELSYPGIKPLSPVSPALHADSLPLSHMGSPLSLNAEMLKYLEASTHLHPTLPGTLSLDLQEGFSHTLYLLIFNVGFLLPA